MNETLVLFAITKKKHDNFELAKMVAVSFLNRRMHIKRHVMARHIFLEFGQASLIISDMDLWVMEDSDRKQQVAFTSYDAGIVKSEQVDMKTCEFYLYYTRKEQDDCAESISTTEKI